jgi:hypothetical protein
LDPTKYKYWKIEYKPNGSNLDVQILESVGKKKAPHSASIRYPKLEIPFKDRVIKKPRPHPLIEDFLPPRGSTGGAKTAVPTPAAKKK